MNPAETLDVSGTILDSPKSDVAVWGAPILFEICVRESATQVTPLCETD